MNAKRYVRNISQIYLTLVPFLGLAIAFAFGHTSYKIYLPIWLLHACLMVLATWLLGAHLVRGQAGDKKRLAVVASFLIVPWILISIFAGIGPLPANSAEWVATATEQQIRYNILIACGVLLACGLVLLRAYLKATGEDFYSLLGITAIGIAMPLFILNMAFWGSYLTEAFKLFVASGSEKRPDWYLPVRGLFESVSMIEVALIYLATMAFAEALKWAGLFRASACNWYILLSAAGLVLSLLPASVPGPLAIASFAVSIPAIPFIMPYLMAVNLLRRVGD